MSVVQNPSKHFYHKLLFYFSLYLCSCCYVILLSINLHLQRYTVCAKSSITTDGLRKPDNLITQQCAQVQKDKLLFIE